MDFRSFTAGPDDNDRRLDRVIRKFADQDSLSGLYKAIRKGLIKVNDKKTDASSHIFEGDVIKIAGFLLSNETAAPVNSVIKQLPFPVVLQTEDLLIINKPYDKTVHGSPDSLDKIVADWYKSAFPENKSLSFKPGPLHRLDRKTTGLLAFSLSLKGARWFTENIATHHITKKYKGIAQGKLLKKEDWIDFISRDYDEEASFQTVNVNNSEIDSTKKAVTHVTPLAYGRCSGTDCTLVEYNIETGRTHQIRAQSAKHGFPLIGDTAYGGRKLSSECSFYLHAAELDLPEDNPLSLPQKIICPETREFESFFKSLV